MVGKGVGGGRTVATAAHLDFLAHPWEGKATVPFVEHQLPVCVRFEQPSWWAWNGALLYLVRTTILRIKPAQPCLREILHLQNERVFHALNPGQR